MENIIIVIVFIAMAVNLPFSIAVNMGLKLKENNPDCAEERADVEGNKKAIKVVQTFNAIISIVLFILLIL